MKVTPHPSRSTDNSETAAPPQSPPQHGWQFLSATCNGDGQTPLFQGLFTPVRVLGRSLENLHLPELLDSRKSH